MNSTTTIRTLLLTTATLALSVACAGAQPTPAPATGGQASAPAAPKIDRLVFAVQAPAIEYFDIRHLNTPNQWAMDPMYESLIGIDPNTGKFTPVLASEWKLDTVNNNVRYKLRQGVKFHKDNGEFTAKDVVIKMREKVRDEPAAAPFSISAYWRQMLKEVEVVNDYEVVYHLKGPSGLLMDSSSDQVGGASMFSSVHLEKVGVPTTITHEPLAGTAPYQFDSRQQSQYIRFSKVPYKHWRTDAEFPGFEFRWIKEASTRMAGLLAGEVHMTDIPDDLIREAEKQGYKTVQGRVPALRTFMSFLCCQFKDVKDPSQGYIDPSSPLTDLRVRRALAKAINYDDLNKGLFGGKGTRMVNNPLHPTRPGWDSSWETRWQEQYGYDQAAARRLLAEAGYSASIPLKVNLPTRSAPGIQSAEDVSEAIAGYWRAAGIDIAIRAVEPGQFSQQSNSLQLFNDVVVQATSANAWTGIFNYGSSLLHRSPGPEQADVDAILDRMRNTSDVEAHTPMWREIGEKLFAAHHFVPLFWLPTTATYNPKYVSDYLFPGSISGNWTHIENIKAAK